MVCLGNGGGASVAVQVRARHMCEGIRSQGAWGPGGVSLELAVGSRLFPERDRKPLVVLSKYDLL